MGNLLKLFAYLFVILFIAGVSWLAYGSYQHMKNHEANIVENVNENLDEDADESLSLNESEGVDDNEDEFEDEDLLEDDEVDELLKVDGVLDEIEGRVKESEAEAAKNELNVKDKLGKSANSLANVGAATLNKAKAGVGEVADKAKVGAGKIADKASESINKAGETAKARVDQLAEKGSKVINKAEKRDVPKEYGKSSKRINTNGRYMVITGSFAVAENAEKEVAAMKKKGFSKTETVQFASTKYLSVCVGRFASRAEAQKMVEKIKKETKIEAYVHRKRMKK